MLIRFSLALAATVLAVLPAVAQSRPAIANTTADLNMRTGPGTGYPVIITIPRGGNVTVSGCTADFSWCDAAFANAKGWVASKYLLYGGGGAYQGQPMATAGTNVGVKRYDREYPTYSAPSYQGGPVYKGDPPDEPAPGPVYSEVQVYEAPPVVVAPVGPVMIRPFWDSQPGYPPRYFEHQVY
ncbi:SH3 domain-containing protein [Roseibium sp. M-1]